MIEIVNDGSIVITEYQEDTKRFAIKTAKEIEVKPKTPLEIKTGVTIKFGHLLDELVILNETNDKLPLCVVSDAYRAADEVAKPLDLTLFFNGTKAIKLAAGDVLAYAKCYHSCTDESPYSYPVYEKDMPIVYIDNTLRIQSVKGEQIDIETVTEADGTRYVKIPLPKLEEVVETTESEEVNE